MGKIRGLHPSNGRIPDKWLQDLIDVINSSDQETSDAIRNAMANLIGQAPETLDTLEEIADEITKINNTMPNIIMSKTEPTRATPNSLWFKIS